MSVACWWCQGESDPIYLDATEVEIPMHHACKEAFWQAGSPIPPRRAGGLEGAPCRMGPLVYCAQCGSEMEIARRDEFRPGSGPSLVSRIDVRPCARCAEERDADARGDALDRGD